METVIAAAVGLSGSLLVWVLVGPVREAFAGRRVRRIARGRPVSFAARVSVGSGRLRHARLSSSGDRIYVRTWRGGFVIPSWRAAVVTRHHEDTADPVSDWLLERHTDPHGRLVDVGTRIEDRRALAALRGTPAIRRPRISGLSLVAAGGVLLGALLLSVLYAVSYDATATVRDVNDDASSCLVEWQQGARTRSTHVDCGSYDAAGVGMTLPIVAQSDPFANQAFSGERGEIFQIDGVILAAVLLILGFGVWRARGPRHPVLLTPVLVNETPAADPAVPPAGSGDVSAARAVELAEEVTTVEGWPRSWEAIQGTTVSPGRDIVGALTGIGWWTPTLFLAAAAAVDPRGLGSILWTVTALAVVTQCVRAIRVWSVLRDLWHRPLSSEWDCVGLPSPDGYCALLCLGQTPHWLVHVSTMPPMSARIRVRGDLAGHFVHLVPTTGDRVLLGRPERYDDELDDDVCEYLRSRLEDYAQGRTD